MAIKHRFWLFFAVFWPLSEAILVAQSPLLEHISVEDGLCYNYVHSSLVDQKGIIWIGTHIGLARYNGRSFHHFFLTSTDSTHIGGGLVKDIFEDEEGILWLALLGTGLDRLDPQTGIFTHYFDAQTPDDGVSKNSPTVIQGAGKNHIWVGGYEMGLNLVEKSTGVCTNYKLSKLPEHATDRFRYNSINDIAYIPADTRYLWLAGNNLGLVRFEMATGEMLAIPPTIHKNRGTSAAMCLFSDRPNELWLGTWSGGIIRYVPETNEREQYLPNQKAWDDGDSYTNVIVKIARKSPTELWVCTQNQGLLVFNEKSRSFTGEIDLGMKPVEYGELTGMEKDRFGRLIITTTKSGLVAYNPPSVGFEWINLPVEKAAERSKKRKVTALADDPVSGGVFCTMLNHSHAFLEKPDEQIEKIPFVPTPYQSQVFNCIFTDSKQRVWFGANNGNHYQPILWQFDRKSRKIQPYLPTDSTLMESLEIYCIQESPHNQIFLGTSKGVIELNPETKKTKLIPRTNFPNARSLIINSLQFDPSGHLWVGTKEDGVYRYNFSKALGENIDFRDSLCDSNISAILCSPTGEMLLSNANNGIRYLQLPTREDSIPESAVFTSDNDFPDNRARNAVRDAFGRFWVQTLSGLALFDPDIPNVDGKIISYDKRSGIQDILLESLGLLASKNGFLYLGQHDGFLKKKLGNEAAIQKNTPKPSVSISNFLVYNESVLGKNTFKLPPKLDLKPGQNMVGIEFSTLDFLKDKGTRYGWQLLGLNDTRSHCFGCEYTSYSNLSHGNYRFEVWIENDFGEKISANVASIDFRIRPFFYQTWWFKGLLALFFLTAIYYFLKWRLNQIRNQTRIKLKEAEYKQKEAELKAKVAEAQQHATEVELAAMRAQMNPHFIFNCLNSINSYIVTRESKTASRYLTKFSKLMRLVLDNSRTNMVSLDSELEILGFYMELEQMRFDNQFAFELMVSPEVPTNEIELPPMLIQPYIENAIWHGLMHKHPKAGLISVHFSLSEQEDHSLLVVVVEDNGIGRKAAEEIKSRRDQNHKSHGRTITQDRLKSLSEVYKIETQIQTEDLYDDQGRPTGTRVTLQIGVEI